MKKRRLKKKVLIMLLIPIVITAYLVTKSQNHTKNDSVNKVNVNEKEETQERRMSILAVGDVLIHESVYKDAYQKNGTYNFHPMFTEVEEILKKYDLKYCNQESTIGGKTIGISGYPSFNSPDEIGDELVDLGFNLISLANNHALDKGMDAILYSNSYWKTKDVVTAGAYSSKEERDQEHIYEKNGIKYAFFAYTTISNAKVPNDYIVNMYSAARAKEDIEKIKDKVDVIIVSMHWGVENTNTPTENQRQIAEYLSSLGVNMIIGAHPHVVEPVEYVGDTLVIYSLGNFISNQLVLGINNGIGLMYGTDIVVDKDGKVTFENEYKELILSYSENSTNFKVIPFSKLTESKLKNYKEIEKQYMEIVNGK